MRKIIVTDLTRFNDQEKVCTAGIDINNGECIRPMPYLQYSDCKRLNLLPGAILSGNFSTSKSIEHPHSEDMIHQNLKFFGYCTDSEFKDVLLQSCSKSIEDGFNVQLENGQKYIPKEQTPLKSIITISANPNSVEIVKDGYDETKIKIHFTDNNSKEYRYLAITDLGFHSYAKNHYKETNNYNEINSVIKNQKEVFLRIGLSRIHTSQQDKTGFWMQVNGIYSFPDYFKNARQYE